MSCEPIHWNMVILLMNVSAQGNELWAQSLKYGKYAYKGEMENDGDTKVALISQTNKTGIL